MEAYRNGRMHINGAKFGAVHSLSAKSKAS